MRCRSVRPGCTPTDRACALCPDVRALGVKEPDMTDKHAVPPRRGPNQVPAMDPPVQRGGVQVRERNGIWEVKVDGKFHGDYHQKDHALAAAALVEVSTR